MASVDDELKCGICLELYQPAESALSNTFVDVYSARMSKVKHQLSGAETACRPLRLLNRAVLVIFMCS